MLCFGKIKALRSFVIEFNNCLFSFSNNLRDFSSYLYFSINFTAVAAAWAWLG